MITGKYKITFTDEKAPKLNCKYSEVNREIIFTPDVEVSDSYSVELVIVKPDNTFTVSTGTISDTGEITVTIPSQATVVKGVGQYLIRIFDNTTNIYSAYGDIWVDDNLLTDEIIESVAEANGYVFPDDFALKSESATINDNTTATNSTWSSSKISEEIAGAVPPSSTYIDDNEVLYDKTWSSEKISHELGNVPGFHVYTTSEQPVGRWVDSILVYERTFIIENVPIGATTLISDASNMTLISAIGAITDDAQRTFPAENKAVNVYIYQNSLQLANNERLLPEARITVRYTKNE